MRICTLLFCACWLCCCTQARTENVKSLKNAKNAATYLLETDLSDNQRLAAGAVVIAVSPAVEYLSTGWFSDLEVEATVPVSAWHQDAKKAEKGVVFQAAKADSANQSWFSQVAGWTGLLYGGISLLFGASGLGVFKKIMNLKNALTESVTYSKEALEVDPKDEQAVKNLKQNAINRQAGTGHQKELAATLSRQKIAQQ